MTRHHASFNAWTVRLPGTTSLILHFWYVTWTAGGSTFYAGLRGTTSLVSRECHLHARGSVYLWHPTREIRVDMPLLHNSTRHHASFNAWTERLTGTTSLGLREVIPPRRTENLIRMPTVLVAGGEVSGPRAEPIPARSEADVNEHLKPT